MPEPDDRLHRLLGATPPPAVAALDPERREALADLIDEARRNQAHSLQESFAATLKHVPFPVRGIVKKVLLG